MLDTREELAAWLRLMDTPGVGRSTARRLLAAFGSPEQVLAAPLQARLGVAGAAVAQALETAPADHLEQVQRTWAWLQQPSAGPRGVLALGEPEYPAALLETADPPLLLYAEGRFDLLQAPCVALVGSRNPSAQGADHAKAFGAALSEAGWTVVSGLALGIDGAAHEGALRGPGSTIAVVGSGLDRIYPERHKALAQRIAQQGLMLSEYPLGTAPLAAHFPPRNRIIAGLSRATLVVEAALQSGSLITARLASEAGREVLAIPGSIHAPQSRGCHALIKQGAKLVESVQDILDELGGWPAAAVPASAPASDPISTVSDAEDAPASASDDPLLAALGQDPTGLDALVARTGWSAAALGVRLLELELQGQVARLPGQLFQRRGQG
jgi:DNA processing protein